MSGAWQFSTLMVMFLMFTSSELPKKPTDIHFTRDGQTIAVSDKFGDIFKYTFFMLLVSSFLMMSSAILFISTLKSWPQISSIRRQPQPTSGTRSSHTKTRRTARSSSVIHRSSLPSF